MDPRDAAPQTVALDFVDIDEVATRLGVKRQTVRQWRQRNIMPDPDLGLRVGPVWRWSTIRTWAIETGRMR